GNDGRLFNFTRGFRTVTYFLRIKDDPDEAGRLMPVLVRQQNGVAEELIEGVERLDFRYVVEDAFNNSHILTADQVQNSTGALGAPLQCQPPPIGIDAPEPGCLWRSLRSVEVSMLVNTVENVLSSSTDNYTYTVDGLINASPTTPMPHGLPPEGMLRREFVASVTVRSLSR
ncbi:MAG: PilW family protein, partial [Xanthomonadales bacterium]|nr:PilW family protein [Xanthomonadales bacterium]